MLRSARQMTPYKPNLPQMLSVMQVVDSLQLGGLESVAANYANQLAERGLRSCLCSTRASGPLEKRLSSHVAHLKLERKGFIDWVALRRLVRFIREQKVDIIHAHGTSLFISVLASWFPPRPKVVWHVHFGRYATEDRSAWPYRVLARGTVGLIVVNEPLAKWAQGKLGFPKAQVWYVPNFVVAPADVSEKLDLPGGAGKRIVCVANLRPEKDHLSLIAAMSKVTRAEPGAAVLLVGSTSDPEYTSKIMTQIRQCGLGQHVFVLGSKSDVWPILRSCDIGVLTSVSEGMPLAVLEYGTAGLPVVATRVGQVPEVLDNGRVGLLIPPNHPDALAAALLQLIHSAELRGNLGRELQRHVQSKFGEGATMDKIVRIYEEILKPAAAQTQRAA